jgi:hypothetical protein
MYHSAAQYGGYVFVVGGVQADGSGHAFADHYRFDPSVPEFGALGANGGPGAIFGHVAVVLGDGRMLVFGGLTNNNLNPFTDIWVLDTTNLGAGWSMASVSGDSVPSPRRGFAATAIDANHVLIQGGQDAEMQNVYGDGWILDTTSSPWAWTQVASLSQLGPRRDHFAVQYGSSVVFGFGA